MIGLLIRLLNVSPKAALAFKRIMAGIAFGAPVIFGDARLESLRKWLWGTPQEQQQVLRSLPPLTTQEEALFLEYQRDMEQRYRVDMLARYVMTLPALPDEGY